MERVAKMQNEVADILKCCCIDTEMLFQKILNSVLQPIRFTSAFAIDVSGCAYSRHGVFHSSMLVFHGSKLFFMVSGWCFMVVHGSRLIFHGSILVFHGSRWFFLWFFMVPG